MQYVMQLCSYVADSCSYVIQLCSCVMQLMYAAIVDEVKHSLHDSVVIHSTSGSDIHDGRAEVVFFYSVYRFFSGELETQYFRIQLKRCWTSYMM